MANIKSAKKRVLTNAKKAERNQAVRSGVKTAVKKVRVAIEAGDKAAAEKVVEETATDGGLFANAKNGADALKKLNID